MGIPRALRGLFETTVDIEPRTGTDKHNNDTYGTSVEFPAHIERSGDLVRTELGHEVVSRRKVFLYNTAWTTSNLPTTNSRLTLPATHAPTQPQIMMVQIAADDNGIHHVVLWC